MDNLISALAIELGARIVEVHTGEEWEELWKDYSQRKWDISSRRLLSHACHTDIDETGIFVGIYNTIETWCDRQKTQSMY